MSSQVGVQQTEVAVIQQAVALEMDCLSALTAAAERAASDATRSRFAQMAADCAEHARRWQMRLSTLAGEPGTANKATAWLNRLKVQVVAPFGERAIAFAITNNAVDSMEAYTRVAERRDLEPSTRELASQMKGDAAAHQAAVAAIRRGTQP